MNIPVRDDAGSSFSPGGPGQLGVDGPDGAGPRSNPVLMIWRRKRVFLAVTLLCVAGAAVRYALADRVYRSEARLFVHASGPKADVADALLGGRPGQTN